MAGWPKAGQITIAPLGRSPTGKCPSPSDRSVTIGGNHDTFRCIISFRLTHFVESIWKGGFLWKCRIDTGQVCSWARSLFWKVFTLPSLAGNISTWANISAFALFSLPLNSNAHHKLILPFRQSGLWPVHHRTPFQIHKWFAQVNSWVNFGFSSQPTPS